MSLFSSSSSKTNKKKKTNKTKKKKKKKGLVSNSFLAVAILLNYLLILYLSEIRFALIFTQKHEKSDTRLTLTRYHSRLEIPPLSMLSLEVKTYGPGIWLHKIVEQIDM